MSVLAKAPWEIEIFGVILCSTSPATVVHLDGVPDERRHRAVVVLGVVDVVGVVGVKLLTDQRVSGGSGSTANTVVADEARDAVVVAVVILRIRANHPKLKLTLRVLLLLVSSP